MRAQEFIIENFVGQSSPIGSTKKPKKKPIAKEIEKLVREGRLNEGWLSSLAATGVVLYILTGGLQGHAPPGGAESVTERIYQQVVDKSINEFKITLRRGELVDIEVHAGIVAAAMLQQQDEGGYATWKSIENSVLKMREAEIDVPPEQHQQWLTNQKQKLQAAYSGL